MPFPKETLIQLWCSESVELRRTKVEFYPRMKNTTFLTPAGRGLAIEMLRQVLGFC